MESLIHGGAASPAAMLLDPLVTGQVVGQALDGDEGLVKKALR